MKKIFLFGIASVTGWNIYAQNISDRFDSLFAAPGNFESLNGSVLIAETARSFINDHLATPTLSESDPTAQSQHSISDRAQKHSHQRPYCSCWKEANFTSTILTKNTFLSFRTPPLPFVICLRIHPD